MSAERTTVCENNQPELLDEKKADGSNRTEGEKCPYCPFLIGAHTKSPTTTAGWLRDLTREGVERNPGPGRCAVGGASSPCICKLDADQATRFARPDGICTTPGCGHHVGLHESAVAVANMSSDFSPTLISVQIWNVDGNVGEEIRSVMVRSLSWTDLSKTVHDVFCDKWSGPTRDLFTLYYIDDLSEPHASRTKVNSNDTLLAYLEFRRTRPRECKQLFLHLPVLLTANGKAVSPTKPPLSVDTHLARQYASSSTAAASPSSRLSPHSADSPLSPGSPREKEQRLLVLARDSDPFTPLTAASKTKAVYPCVFCGEFFIPKLLEAAHLVPSSVQERLGKDVDELLLVELGGLHGVRNGVTACETCHTLFDDGNVWALSAPVAESASSASTSSAAPTQPMQLLLQVDDTVRADAHAARLHGRMMKQPIDARLRSAFPPEIWWSWRREWAELKRADAMARELAKLQVSGTCACGSSWNAKCKNKSTAGNPLCRSCCLAKQNSADGVSCPVHRR